jgi:hypothetical protein
MTPSNRDALPTHSTLGSLLPGGVWPSNAVSELLYQQEGLGEMSLLLPTLAAATQRQLWCAGIGMPHHWLAGSLVAAGIDLNYWLALQPFNDKLKLWAAEQVLQARVGLLLLWLSRLERRQSQRLQLAASRAEATVIVLTPLPPSLPPTTAIARLALTQGKAGAELHLLKYRGRLPTSQAHPQQPWGV